MVLETPGYKLLSSFLDKEIETSKSGQASFGLQWANPVRMPSTHQNYPIAPLLAWKRERRWNGTLMGQDQDSERDRSLISYHHRQNRP